MILFRKNLISFFGEIKITFFQWNCSVHARKIRRFLLINDDLGHFGPILFGRAPYLVIGRINL